MKFSFERRLSEEFLGNRRTSSNISTLQFIYFERSEGRLENINY